MSELTSGADPGSALRRDSCGSLSLSVDRKSRQFDQILPDDVLHCDQSLPSTSSMLYTET